jgi:hypothetical protein
MKRKHHLLKIIRIYPTSSSPSIIWVSPMCFLCKHWISSRCITTGIPTTGAKKWSDLFFSLVLPFQHIFLTGNSLEHLYLSGLTTLAREKWRHDRETCFRKNVGFFTFFLHLKCVFAICICFIIIIDLLFIDVRFINFCLEICQWHLNVHFHSPDILRPHDRRV